MILLLVLVTFFSCKTIARSFRQNVSLQSSLQPFKEPVNPCAICLEEILPLESCYFDSPMKPVKFHSIQIDLPLDYPKVNHFFHRKCLEEYGKSKNSCPYCRQPSNNASPNDYLYSYCWSKEIHPMMKYNLISHLNKATGEGIITSLGICLSENRFTRISDITALFARGLREDKKQAIKDYLSSQRKVFGESKDFHLAFVQMIPSVAEGVAFLSDSEARSWWWPEKKQIFSIVLQKNYQWENLIAQFNRIQGLVEFFIEFAWENFEKKPFDELNCLELTNIELIQAVFEENLSQGAHSAFAEAVLTYYHSSPECEFFHTHIKHLIPEEFKARWEIWEKGSFYAKPWSCPKCCSEEPKEADGICNKEN